MWNNFEEYEAFPHSVMRPEDMTDQEVTGFNDDVLLPRGTMLIKC